MLILASLSTIKPSEAMSIWSTGWSSRLAIVTHVSLDAFAAHPSRRRPRGGALGIALSERVLDRHRIGRAREAAHGRIEERKPPKQLPANQVTVLHVYGHLFFAGARTLERLLPTPQGAQSPVVILRLRGHTSVGATLIEVLANYAGKLQAVNGRLYLSGISAGAYDQIVRTGKLRLTGPVRAYEATPIV